MYIHTIKGIYIHKISKQYIISEETTNNLTPNNYWER